MSMDSPQPLYAKLPGRGRRGSAIFSYARSRLWLGDDHLLAVDFTVASEEYRRFYFRDIEAVIIRRTSGRQVWNWILCLLLLLSAGPFVALWWSEGEGGFLVASIILALFWLVFIVINSARGATCQTHLRTAVQQEQLPSLGRLPVARKVLARVQPLIVAAQGAATPEELANASWMAVDTRDGVRIPVGAAQQARTKPPRVDRGRLHAALFSLLLAEAILTAVAYFLYAEPISIFSLIALFAGGVICIVALVRQAGTDLSAFVRGMAKIAIGYYAIKCVIGFVFMMIFSIKHPGTQMVTGLEMMNEPGLLPAALISAAVGAVLGSIGFVALAGHFRRQTVPPAL